MGGKREARGRKVPVLWGRFSKLAAPVHRWAGRTPGVEFIILISVP